MAKTRKGGRKSKKRGGSAVGGLMAAIKKALPSYKQLCNIPKQKVRIETASIVMVWIM